MQTVTRETRYPSRRAFCCGLGAALALPIVDLSVLAQAPAAQAAAGPPMLPLRSPGLEPCRWSITSVHSSTTIADARCVLCSRREAFNPQASA